MSAPWITSFLVTLLIALANCNREEKGLHYRQINDDLNIEHIISLWNRSATEESTSTKSYVTTTLPTTKAETTTERMKEKPPKVLDTFPERLNFCVKKLKMSAKHQPSQGILMKCLKAELITKLQQFLSQPSETIKLFNGYLEFEKIDRKDEKMNENEVSKNESDTAPLKKKYSSRVSSKKPLDIEGGAVPLIPVALKQPKSSQSHANDYYEAYQKMLKELVARKNGAELKREKRDFNINSGTLEKSAKLFENGRKLFTEINNNLESREEEVETLTETILDPELVTSINNFTKSYSLRLNFYPGIAARMKRNENSGVTFDLELDDINETEDDSNESQDGGRGGKKKKKPKISKKTLKKLFPYLLIPFMIQAALLPIVLKFLLFVAIKALIAGKLALILVAFNAIRNASLKSDEDEYIERMSYDHYGYGHGEEYGAWVNRRNIVVPKEEEKEEFEEEEHFAEPYKAYRPN